MREVPGRRSPHLQKRNSVLIRMHMRRRTQRPRIASINMRQIDPIPLRAGRVRRLLSRLQRALIKIHRPRVNIRCPSIRNRRQRQVVPSLLHPAAAVRAKRIVPAIRNAIIRNLRPTRPAISSSPIQRLPDALVECLRIPILIRLHIDHPHIHFIASRHHRKLAAINQARRRIRTRRTIRRC